VAVARRQLQFPKAASAQSKGAVAVVIYDRDDRFEADGETLNLIDRAMTTGGAEDTVGIPVFAIIMAQGEAIIAGINTYGARATGSFHCAEGGAATALTDHRIDTETQAYKTLSMMNLWQTEMLAGEFANAALVYTETGVLTVAGTAYTGRAEIGSFLAAFAPTATNIGYSITSVGTDTFSGVYDFGEAGQFDYVINLSPGIADIVSEVVTPVPAPGSGSQRAIRGRSCQAGGVREVPVQSGLHAENERSGRRSRCA
jgi:hypothetical protein